MQHLDINLTNPYYAYLFGFIQTDGHLYNSTRDRGRLSIEVSKRDEAILWAFKDLLPFNSSITERVRATNFSCECKSVIWRVYERRFREYLELWGLVSGRKSELVQPSRCCFSKVDYFRGIIDGDGSLGLTVQGFPFLSLVTSSSYIAAEYLDFIQQMTGKSKSSSRNVRDQVYNIAVYKEDAQRLTQCLYYNHCLALPRKLAKADEVLHWKRPIGMKQVPNRIRWVQEEDVFIMSHSIESSMEALGRSRSSIELRLWRLRKLNQQLVTN